jgi:hypothetical protein
MVFTGSCPPAVESIRFSGGNEMRSTILSVAVAAALLPLFVGCSSQRGQVARSQSPSATYVTAHGDEVCDDPCDEECEGPRCKRCHGRGCSHCRPYSVPRDLSYPPPGPPAIVQYPYYTCKGPDCFFHQ